MKRRVTAVALVVLVAFLFAVAVRDARVLLLLKNSLLLSVGAVALAVPPGTLLAVVVFKTPMPGRRFARLVLVAMLFVPLFVVAAAWDAGFGMQGWFTQTTNPRLVTKPWLAGWRAAVWVHALAGVPWVALIVGVALRSAEPDLEEDAALVASPWRVLWNVSLRRAAPAIVAATMWVAVIAMSEIAVTDLFQIRTFAEEVYTQSALGAWDFGGQENMSSEQGGPSTPTDPGAPVLFWAGIMFVVALTVVALAVVSMCGSSLASPPTRPLWMAPLGRAKWPVTIGAWTLLSVVAGVPLANLAYKAGITVHSTETGRVRSWSLGAAVWQVVQAPVEHRRELGQSALIGTLAATTAIAVGGMLAWSMRAPRRWPVLRAAVVAACAVVPGPLLGIATIRLLNQPPDSPFAFLAWCYDRTLLAPWLVQTVRSLPVAVIILWPALASVPQATLDAAASEGATWLRRLVFVALPTRWGAIVAAWLLALAVSVGELAATVLVIPPGPTTASIRIFSLIHYGVDDRVAALCLVVVAAVALATTIGTWLALRPGSSLGDPTR